MLNILTASVPGLRPVESLAGWSMPADAVWIDLHEPSREQEVAIEGALGVELPTREEMAEIEPSSRLYQEAGATVMIASLLVASETDQPRITPVTFVLAGDRLVTIRYAEPRAFGAFAGQAERQPDVAASGVKVFIGLLDAVIDRLADVLERTSGNVEKTSRDIFARPRSDQFESVIDALGRAHVIDSKVRDSLVSLSRMLSFGSLADQIEADADCREHVKSLLRDIQSLTDHATYQSGNITFLLDTAMGLINIEQNSILKRFSVISIMLMPPTLIAGIYGMNFHNLPELDLRYGYYGALIAMVVFAVAPILYFRRRGWL